MLFATLLLLILSTLALKKGSDSLQLTEAIALMDKRKIKKLKFSHEKLNFGHQKCVTDYTQYETGYPRNAFAFITTPIV